MIRLVVWSIGRTGRTGQARRRLVACLMVAGDDEPGEKGDDVGEQVGVGQPERQGE